MTTAPLPNTTPTPPTFALENLLHAYQGLTDLLAEKACLDHLETQHLYFLIEVLNQRLDAVLHACIADTGAMLRQREGA